MKGPPVGSKNFKWTVDTRLLLLEVLAMVDKDQASKRRNIATPAAELQLAHAQKWEQVASWLPPVFNAIDPSRCATTCYSQFNQLRQRLKLMRLDQRNRYRRASDGKADPLMTNELCWKLADYLQGSRIYRGPGRPRKVTTNQVGALDCRPPLLEDGHEKHISARNHENQVCKPVHANCKLHESQADEPRQDRRGLKGCSKEVRTERRTLYKVPRSGMYRWSEDARLQVIQGVKMMKGNLSQGGHIKSWRDIAAGLPKNLFWDVDLDRLACIAKKQFSEMSRRYRLTMELKNAGAEPPLKFKTLTKRVLHEMATLEERRLQLTSRAHRRRFCKRKESNLNPWVTITPSVSLDEDQYRGAHGAVLVEIVPWRSKLATTENDSFGGVFAEYDPAYDQEYGRSVVPSDGCSSWSSGRPSADSQTAAESSGSEEYENNESSSYSKLQVESESDHYPNASEDHDVTNRKRSEGCFLGFDKSLEERDRQGKHVVSSQAPSAAERDSEPKHKTDSERTLISKSECFGRQRGLSSAISISSDGCEPDSDCPNDGAHVPNQEGKKFERRHSHSSGSSDSEESWDGRHDGNSDGNKKGDLQRQKRTWQRGIRPFAADEPDHSHSDESPENSTGSSEYSPSESLHGNSDQGGDHSYDSASSDKEAMSHGDAAHSPADHSLELRNKLSESGDFGQCPRPTEEYQNGERLESFARCLKTSSPAHSQWGETTRRGHGTPQDRHPQRELHLRARSAIEQPQVNSDATVKIREEATYSSGPDHEGPPVLKKMLSRVDLEFSKMNWWVQHELLPREREKIKNAMRSTAIIPSSLNGMGPSVGGCDEVVLSAWRQNGLRSVLAAELQQVRLKLLEEIDKSSQVVIQEILQSSMKK